MSFFFRHADGARDPKVRDYRGTALQQDVLGLDVAVYDAVAVRVGERARHFGRDPHCLVNRELLFPLQPVAQRLALDVWHDVIEEAVDGTGVVQRQDMRVLQPGGDRNLAEEAIASERGRQLGVQDLDRDWAVVLQVLGEEDRGHPAPAKLPLDGVVLDERVTQSFEKISH